MILNFLKQNNLARTNFTPAFRYFVAFATLRPQNTSIGATLKALPARTKFSSYIAILITCCFLILIAQPAFAQNIQYEKEIPKKIAFASKTKYSLKDNINHFTYKAKKAALYDVIVLSPVADIKSRPVKSKALSADEKLDFSINTKSWKPGTYRIFIQTDGETVEQQKLTIKRNRWF